MYGYLRENLDARPSLSTPRMLLCALVRRFVIAYLLLWPSEEYSMAMEPHPLINLSAFLSSPSLVCIMFGHRVLA